MFCDTWDCKQNYIDYIFYCHEHMKNFLHSDIYYNEEFMSTLQIRFDEVISAYKMENQINTTMNALNILNTLVSSSLYIHYNLDKDDVVIRNETLSLDLKNTQLKGYTVHGRRTKSKSNKYTGTRLYLL